MKRARNEYSFVLNAKLGLQTCKPVHRQFAAYIGVSVNSGKDRSLRRAHCHIFNERRIVVYLKALLAVHRQRAIDLAGSHFQFVYHTKLIAHFKITVQRGISRLLLCADGEISF